MESKSEPEEVAKSKTEEGLAKIAAKVREDSKNLKKLTRVDLFATLTPERTGVCAYLAEMVELGLTPKESKFKDFVKWLGISLSK